MTYKLQENLKTFEENTFILSADTYKRLNQKTQVITDSNSYSIRTRLTHSLEVSSIGSYIAENINTELGIVLTNPNVVANVGHIHDIGHSPLGHVGACILNEELTRYGLNFEDNANSLTILEKYYPNMSDIVLLSSIKYPFYIGDNPEKVEKGLYKNQGHYIDRLNLVCKTQAKFIKSKKVAERTFESYIMEFADDISYLTGDLEDFILHFDGKIHELYLRHLFDKYDVEQELNEEFEILCAINKKNANFSIWTLRKYLIRDVSFDITNNKFDFKNKKYHALEKILRILTFELYIDKHSIRPDDKLAASFRDYIRYLYENLEDHKFIRKQLNSRRYKKLYLATDDLHEKAKILSQAISEFTDKHLLKNLKKFYKKRKS